MTIMNLFEGVKDFLLSPFAGWISAFAFGIFGTYQWIKREKKSIEFEIVQTGLGPIVSRDGINYPWETIHFQLKLDGSVSRLAGVSAVIIPGNSNCITPSIWIRGQNHALGIKSSDIELKENMTFSLKMLFRDLDGNVYSYALPLTLVRNGSLNLEVTGVGKRKRLFLRNLLNF